MHKYALACVRGMRWEMSVCT